ncbi:MAG: response regulator [Paenirhodobacter sp.]|uniref:response regulator n=1 Tax=Paenirhodobacter sp. TaxID=1965326 RepID=UPI003D0E3FF6
MQHDVQFLAKLAAVRARFLKNLSEFLPRYEELQEIFRAIERPLHLVDSAGPAQPETPLPIDLIPPLRDHAHKIAGSAQTFGFPSLSELARDLELALELSQAPLADEKLHACLERFLSAARALIVEAQRSGQVPPLDVPSFSPVTPMTPAPSVPLSPATQQRIAAPLAAPPAEPEPVESSPDEAEDAGVPSPAPPRIAAQPVHVLVVDDDDLVRDYLRSGLATLGWRMSEATSGLDAVLTLFACSGAPPEDRPDLILMDVNMPEMDGFSALERIRQSPIWSEIPIVLLTRRDDDVCQIRGFMGGADDYMTKPFDLAKIAQRIPDLIHARARRVLLGVEEGERRQILAQELRAAGLIVRIAHSTEDAWNAMQQEPPAAALFDLDLRGGGGLSLIAGARNDPKMRRMQIVIAVPDDYAELRIAAIEAGAADCLPYSCAPPYAASRMRVLLGAAKPG